MSTMEQGAQLFEFIPEEIMFEILTRLPVRSLLKFRCVCKSWNSLISSPYFINTHLHRHDMDSSCDLILVQTRRETSLYCAKTFVKHMDLNLPSCLSSGFFVFGSCNGLLCIRAAECESFKSSMYIWNPSNRKIITLPQSLFQYHINTEAGCYINGVGFGFHHQKNDYEVVRTVRFKEIIKAEVYSLRLNSWRELSAVLPFSVYFEITEAIHVNGVLYWKVENRNPRRAFILSFDMDNEVFQQMELPEKLGIGFDSAVGIRVFEKSLSLIHLRQESQDEDHLVRHFTYCDIWVMRLDTWKMIRTILLLPQVRLFSSYYGRVPWPLSFTTDGVYIVRPDGVQPEFDTLVVYDPISQEAKETRVKIASHCFMSLHAYKESLILL